MKRKTRGGHGRHRKMKRRHKEGKQRMYKKMEETIKK